MAAPSPTHRSGIARDWQQSLESCYNGPVRAGRVPAGRTGVMALSLALAAVLAAFAGSKALEKRLAPQAVLA